jgi:hypothetical protein
VAIILPIAKVGAHSCPLDFRCNRIVSNLSKAFERILHDQVLEHVNGCCQIFNLVSDVGAFVRATENLSSAKAFVENPPNERFQNLYF